MCWGVPNSVSLSVGLSTGLLALLLLLSLLALLLLLALPALLLLQVLWFAPGLPRLCLGGQCGHRICPVCVFR